MKPSKRLIISRCLIALMLLSANSATARDLEVGSNQGEIDIFVNPGEPTQLEFPGEIAGGYKRKNSLVSIDKQNKDLIVFGSQNMGATGESFIVRLVDGRSYSIRIKRATDTNPRDEFVSIFDKRGSIISGDEEETPAHEEKSYQYAPATQVSGLMREMVLAAEFGKQALPGYTRSDKYKGQVILNDGTILATIDSIFIGPNLWGYVVEATNLIDQTQRLNPATFRLDGTRAVSSSNWELAPRPFNIEQQISGKHNAKIYIVTKARR